MKRTFVAIVLSVLAVLSLAPTGTAAPKSGATTLYFHGAHLAGEVDTAETFLAFSYMGMDSEEPTSPAPKSVTYGWGNTDCVGNRLHPVWLGQVSGTIVGDVKVVFDSASYSQDIDVRIWTDVNQMLCNESYFEPRLETTVTVPQGRETVTAVLKNSKLPVKHFLMVQISPTFVGGDTPGFGRILYDSSAAPSRVEFTLR